MLAVRPKLPFSLFGCPYSINKPFCSFPSLFVRTSLATSTQYVLSWQTCGRWHYGPRQSKRSFCESPLRCIAWWQESMSTVSLHAARTWGESTDSLPEGEKISWNTYLDLKRHHPGELGLWSGSAQLHFRLSGIELCFFTFLRFAQAK